MSGSVARPAKILDPGLCLTLRPMVYPIFFEMYRAAIKNTWTVEEVDFSTDVRDLAAKTTEAERHLVQRLVAFFATGDSIVANNVVLNLYRHLNAPEARMYLSRQLYEEALHVQFYLTLLDTYIPDHKARFEAFAAVESIPSIRRKAEFCMKWLESTSKLQALTSKEERREFLLNLICFAACVEGLFFFAAFAYVYFFRSRGLFHGLAAGTSWVFRDESCVVDGSEVLTPRGWVDFRELKPGDAVAQFNMETAEISFVQPTRVIRKPYRGKVRHIRSRKGGIDQCMTMDHSIVQRWDHQTTWSKQTAAEFKLNGKKQIPVSGFVPGDRHLTTRERFLIAFQADGSLSDRYTGERCGTVPIHFTFAKQRKIDRLLGMIDELGWEFSAKDIPGEGPKSPTKVFTVHVPVSEFDGRLHDMKTFTWVNLGEADATFASEFIEEIRHWDGYQPKDADNGYYVYYSSTIALNADVVQALAVMCGRHASRSLATDERSAAFSDSHRLWIHESMAIRAFVLDDEELDYDGEVHCVTVPTGAFVMRYNGKVSITGNCHMTFAFEVVKTVRKEEPELFDAALVEQVGQMLDEAIACEVQFAEDLLSGGVVGLSPHDMKSYLEHCADQRLSTLGMKKRYESKNPFTFMDLQDAQELANFFERRVSAYQVGVGNASAGEVAFDKDF